MHGLFISYRREDTAPYAGRLCDFLRREFPDDDIFMDIDAIDPGEDFVDAINRTLAASKIVIAVIGPKWLQITDASGARRLDNPDDYVVRELCAALESNARVIPVLVGGAAMPRSDSLPSRLQPLTRRNAIEISDTRFSADAERLSAAILRFIEPTAAENKPIERTRGRGERRDTSLAHALTKFKILLWIGYALGVFSIVFAIDRVSDEEVLLVFGIVVFALGAWLNLMIIRGKTWARIWPMTLVLVLVACSLIEWADQSAAELALNVAALGLAAWLIRAMFTEPIKRIFVRA